MRFTGRIFLAAGVPRRSNAFQHTIFRSALIQHKQVSGENPAHRKFLQRRDVTPAGRVKPKKSHQQCVGGFFHAVWWWSADAGSIPISKALRQVYVTCPRFWRLSVSYRDNHQTGVNSSLMR